MLDRHLVDRLAAMRARRELQRRYRKADEGVSADGRFGPAPHPHWRLLGGVPVMPSLPLGGGRKNPRSNKIALRYGRAGARSGPVRSRALLADGAQAGAGCGMSTTASTTSLSRRAHNVVPPCGIPPSRFLRRAARTATPCAGRRCPLSGVSAAIGTSPGQTSC
jgi:hypothetical protein